MTDRLPETAREMRVWLGLPVLFLGTRTMAKRVLLGGYCHGWIPAFVVTAGFRLLRLRGL